MGNWGFMIQPDETPMKYFLLLYQNYKLPSQCISSNSYKARSINTILKSQTRSKQYCMFFNKFGKCNKKEKGICPYIHDPDKVAVCRKFLAGSCLNGECLLSHKVAPEKMPSCKFFLEGNCTRTDQCPYRHVKVNDSAQVSGRVNIGQYRLCTSAQKLKKMPAKTQAFFSYKTGKY